MKYLDFQYLKEIAEHVPITYSNYPDFHSVGEKHVGSRHGRRFIHLKEIWSRKITNKILWLLTLSIDKEKHLQIMLMTYLIKCFRK